MNERAKPRIRAKHGYRATAQGSVRRKNGHSGRNLLSSCIVALVPMADLVESGLKVVVAVEMVELFTVSLADFYPSLPR